jgi:hypothetical protein
MPFSRRRKNGKIVHYASFMFEGRLVQELVGTDRRQAEQLERQRKHQVKDGTYVPGTVAKRGIKTMIVPLEVWPRTGGVYFVRIGEFVKIGKARNVSERLHGLQTAHPQELQLLAVATGGVKEEQEYHERFMPLHVRGEWFRLEWPITEEIQRLREEEFNVASPAIAIGGV